MNLKELRTWCEENYRKDNPTLIADGVKASALEKVRNILKHGIVDRVKIITANTEKNNKYMGDIEIFLKDLVKLGLPSMGYQPPEVEEPVKPQHSNQGRR